MNDMHNKGRYVKGKPCRGEQSPNAKLSEAEVREIKGRIRQTPERKLAAEFGVSRALIRAIKQERAWAWI
jgi:DNA-binding FadR family transcriptional regulator